MKAIICSRFGPPDSLAYKEVEQPVPGDDEVLVKVHASSVNTNNLLMITGDPFFVRLMGIGLIKPKTYIPGSDVSGVVESVGNNVDRFEPGDEVFGELPDVGYGTYAECAAVPEDALAIKPQNITFEEAAACPQAAQVALEGLCDQGNIKEGQQVLIYGASGGIGSFAVQLAKYFGAEVTGVCSTPNLELVQSIGADHVIDYTSDPYPPVHKRYDLILAIAYRSNEDHLNTLKPGGTYVSVGSPSLKRIYADMIKGPRMFRKAGKRIAGGWSITPTRDLDSIRERLENGDIKPVIDKRYPLKEASEALRYYSRGHSHGKVVITVKS